MYENPIVNLGGGNSKIVYFHFYLGKIPILTNIFQMDWNHQLEMMRDKLPNYQPQLVEVGFLNHQPYHTEYTAKKTSATVCCCSTQSNNCHMGVSENSGFPPKSSIFIGVFHYTPSILGVFTLFLETPTFCTTASKICHCSSALSLLDQARVLDLHAEVSRPGGSTARKLWWHGTVA